MPRPRPRGALTYDKPPLSLDELGGRLADRGLDIPDPERSRRYLRHLGYYRLSPYTIPFQQGRPDHRIREGTPFDDVLDLYVFDRALRLLVMDALERVEVAVRAALTDYMSTTYTDPHWYMDVRHFRDSGKHARLLDIVSRTCDERLRGTPDAGEDALVHRSALEHYLTTYGSPDLPPSWLMVETLTIGQLTIAYRNLRQRADRTAVARSIGLTTPVLGSWTQTYVRVRNNPCPPRAALERGPRGLPGNPDLARRLMARGRPSSAREVEEAPLPGASCHCHETTSTPSCLPSSRPPARPLLSTSIPNRTSPTHDRRSLAKPSARPAGAHPPRSSSLRARPLMSAGCPHDALRSTSIARDGERAPA